MISTSQRLPQEVQQRFLLKIVFLALKFNFLKFILHAIPTHPFIWPAPRLVVEIPDRNRAGTQTFVPTAINNERVVFYIGAFLFTYYDFYCLLKWKFGAYWAEIFHINHWNQDGENVNFVFQKFDSAKRKWDEKARKKTQANVFL